VISVSLFVWLKLCNAVIAAMLVLILLPIVLNPLPTRMTRSKSGFHGRK
jgi:hypothetical protein